MITITEAEYWQSLSGLQVIASVQNRKIADLTAKIIDLETKLTRSFEKISSKEFLLTRLKELEGAQEQKQ